jgi:hypothetical protein
MLFRRKRKSLGRFGETIRKENAEATSLIEAETRRERYEEMKRWRGDGEDLLL